jgi:hypothetical protein
MLSVADMNAKTPSWRQQGESQVDPFQDPVAYLRGFGIEAELVDTVPEGLTEAA